MLKTWRSCDQRATLVGWEAVDDLDGDQPGQANAGQPLDQLASHYPTNPSVLWQVGTSPSLLKFSHVSATSPPLWLVRHLTTSYLTAMDIWIFIWNVSVHFLFYFIFFCLYFISLFRFQSADFGPKVEASDIQLLVWWSDDQVLFFFFSIRLLRLTVSPSVCSSIAIRLHSHLIDEIRLPV